MANRNSVEHGLMAMPGNHLIVRLSKVYGVERGDGKLLDNIAAPITENRKIQVAHNQIFCPTLLADVVAALHAARGRRGVLNLCAPEVVSRQQIAEMMADALGVSRSLVEALPLHSIPGMEGRPLNLSMECTRLQNEIDPLRFTPLNTQSTVAGPCAFSSLASALDNAPLNS